MRWPAARAAIVAAAALAASTIAGHPAAASTSRPATPNLMADRSSGRDAAVPLAQTPSPIRTTDLASSGADEPASNLAPVGIAIFIAVSALLWLCVTIGEAIRARFLDPDTGRRRPRADPLHVASTELAPPPGPPAPPAARAAAPLRPAPQRAQPAQSRPHQTVAPRTQRLPAALVIQQAVAATAEAYRERLRSVLERQDGPAWLDEFNRRRGESIADGGGRPPIPYRSFEDRAVLNCLGHDAAAEQVIPAAVSAKARTLAKLSQRAHHPDPSDPPTEADADRAWRLHAEITGQLSNPDPTDP